MNHQLTKSQPTIERQRHCPFVKALSWTCVGWAMSTAILWIVVDPAAVDDAMLIAVGSGLVACLALLPGILIQLATPTGQPGSRESQLLEPWGRLIVAVALGIAIRSTGTVALFLTYRYQLASSTEMIAAMALGWYVFLTSIEVIVLARTLPETARPPEVKVSVHVDPSMPVKV